MAHQIERIIEDALNSDIQYVVWRDGLACHVDAFSFGTDFAPKMKAWEKDNFSVLEKIALKLIAKKDINQYPDISKAHEMMQYFFNKCLTCKDRIYVESFSERDRMRFISLQKDMKKYHVEDMFIFFTGRGLVQVVVHTGLKTKFKYFKAPSCIAP